MRYLSELIEKLIEIEKKYGDIMLDKHTEVNVVDIRIQELDYGAFFSGCKTGHAPRRRFLFIEQKN